MEIRPQSDTASRSNAGRDNRSSLERHFTSPAKTADTRRDSGPAVVGNRADHGSLVRTLTPQNRLKSKGNRETVHISDVRRRLGDSPRSLATVAGERTTKSEFRVGQPLTTRFSANRARPEMDSLRSPHPQKSLAAPTAHDARKVRFTDQVRSGSFGHVTDGEHARKLKLHDQYKMWKTGDVARRLDLQKHGPRPADAKPHGGGPNHDRWDVAGIGHHRPDFHRGLVDPHYARGCMAYRYWGPSFFAGVCWYPRWNPWVEWSWYNHCHPFWDPRPLWCRPIFYDPCPTWIYWDIPAWTPLPVVTCGTWVDLSPAVVPVEQYDLELLAVRFVDPGHPAEHLGPRYRVWFRNNSALPITQPFNVMLFAGNDGTLRGGLPQAGVRVTAIDANDVQSVDIRLPEEVYTMGRDANGNPCPFNTLHVLVDANREVAETTLANNGAHLTPAEILPVDPAAFELQPIAAKSEGEVLLAGEGFGPQPGQVLLMVNGKEYEAEILGWYDLGVRFKLPKMIVVAATNAEIVVVRGDGAAANPLAITLSP